jgi:hypothetical protein
MQNAPERGRRYAVRWLRRLLEEDENLTIEETTLAAWALAALGSGGHDQAMATLSDMAERATRRPSRRY